MVCSPKVDRALPGPGACCGVGASLREPGRHHRTTARWISACGAANSWAHGAVANLTGGLVIFGGFWSGVPPNRNHWLIKANHNFAVMALRNPYFIISNLWCHVQWWSTPRGVQALIQSRQVTPHAHHWPAMTGDWCLGFDPTFATNLGSDAGAGRRPADVAFEANLEVDHTPFVDFCWWKLWWTYFCLWTWDSIVFPGDGFLFGWQNWLPSCEDFTVAQTEPVISIT